MTVSGSAAVPTSGGAVERIPIDPRILERRIAVRRSEGRRRLRMLLVALSVCAAAGAGVGALHSPLVAANTVTVTGNRQTPRDTVLKATGLDQHPLMINVNGSEVAAVIRRLPWVADVKVRRTWPSTVRISVIERRAIAVVAAAGGGVDAVDVTGRVLATGAQTFPGLPLVSGIPPAGLPGTSTDAVAGPGLTVAQALPSALSSRIAQIAVGNDGSVTLHLAGGGPLIQLGATDLLSDKLQALQTILTRVDLRGVTLVDVRVPRAPVLTRQ